MKKIKYSNFESVQDILSTMDFNFDADKNSEKEEIYSFWNDIVGDKLAKLSKPVNIKENGTMIVSCANSFIANELFLIKNHLLSILEEKIQNHSIKVRDLFFDYKNWKK